MSSGFTICIGLLLVFANRLNAENDDSKVADAINNYGLGYYKQQINNNQNTLVSGYGAATAYTMMLTGARTDTERELKNTLGYNQAGLSKNQIENSFNRILTKQQNHDPAYDLRIGNSLWTQSGFNVLPDFKTDLASNFLAYEKVVDFGSSSSTNAIKTWITNVTQQTKNSLFGGFNINSEVVSLINVLFLSGRMKIPFYRNGLQNQAFTSSDGTSKSILMMRTENQFNYSFSQDLNAEMLEIPYNGNEVSMYIFLPKAVTGLTNLEQQLTLANLKATIAGLQTSIVALTMPFATSFTQVGTFSYLLLKTADQVDSDLSGIDGKQDLYDAQDGQNYGYRYGTQSTFAETDAPGQSQVIFNANHPFLYFFRHKPTDIILFMGRMASP